MSLQSEFDVLWAVTHRSFGIPSERREQAFRAFPPHLKPATLNSAKQLAARNARHEADAAGMRRPAFTVERLLVGEPPHQGHALRFNYADGTSDYFAPHKT